MSENIYQAVLCAMQSAEELGGPDAYDYVVLMQRIATEANRRAAQAVRYVKSEIHVLMRPPREGERGWWVTARTPGEALVEVLGEMDDGGWIAGRDYDGTPDEHGMIAITVVIGGKP